MTYDSTIHSQDASLRDSQVFSQENLCHSLKVGWLGTWDNFWSRSRLSKESGRLIRGVEGLMLKWMTDKADHRIYSEKLMRKIRSHGVRFSGRLKGFARCSVTWSLEHVTALDCSGSEALEQSFHMAHVNTESRKNLVFQVEYESGGIRHTLPLHPCSILFLAILFNSFLLLPWLDGRPRCEETRPLYQVKIQDCPSQGICFLESKCLSSGRSWQSPDIYWVEPCSRHGAVEMKMTRLFPTMWNVF